ncbi:MAG: hypothetical protein H7327_08195 [Herminiimonas sp.]|nr:hypothetical protein [Herminiimonas sp.]
MEARSRIKPISYLKSCAENKETLALLKVLALGQKSYEEGKYSSADDFFAEMDKEILGEDSSD